jgi:hypothetical protein
MWISAVVHLAAACLGAYEYQNCPWWNGNYLALQTIDKNKASICYLERTVLKFSQFKGNNYIKFWTGKRSDNDTNWHVLYYILLVSLHKVIPYESAWSSFNLSHYIKQIKSSPTTFHGGTWRKRSYSSNSFLTWANGYIWYQVLVCGWLLNSLAYRSSFIYA